MATGGTGEMEKSGSATENIEGLWLFQVDTE